MEDNRVRSVLRMMAWERAKGELTSILQTYYDDEGYDGMEKATRAFIKKVEENDLVA